jgi:hypothetical protein
MAVLVKDESSSSSKRGEAVTEADWLDIPHPAPLLDFLVGKISPRKLGLYACACCRRIWHLLADERSRKAIEVAERFADGEAGKLERNEADLEAGEAANDASSSRSTATSAVCCAVSDFAAADAWESVKEAGAHAAFAAKKGVKGRGATAYDAELEAQAGLLRDIVGDPFRPVALDPSWLAWDNGVVRRIAQDIYEGRAFHELPILADAPRMRDARIPPS